QLRAPQAQVRRGFRGAIIGGANLLLQRMELGIELEQRRELRERDAAIVVVAMLGIAGPCEPDPALRGRSQALAPAGAAFVVDAVVRPIPRDRGGRRGEREG